MSKPKKIAILTAGGLAPCLSSAIGSLIERYSEIDPSIEIICYRSGYKGLLLGDYYTVTPKIRENAGLLHDFGGSPIGNSRVKLTNIKENTTIDRYPIFSILHKISNYPTISINLLN